MLKVDGDKAVRRRGHEIELRSNGLGAGPSLRRLARRGAADILVHRPSILRPIARLLLGIEAPSAGCGFDGHGSAERSRNSVDRSKDREAPRIPRPAL
jgi:hypothetical protein